MTRSLRFVVGTLVTAAAVGVAWAAPVILAGISALPAD
jgi:hypothetical protein